MKNRASVPFSNGVVEYNFQGNGGNNEFGLMYRGQSPETSNSYVFYPTSFNAQNTWQNYALVSGRNRPQGAGGSFAQGDFVRDKGSDRRQHAHFSINGTPTIRAIRTRHFPAAIWA